MKNTPDKERKCENCMAHYTGNHTCPPFMKMLKDLGSGENAYKIVENHPEHLAPMAISETSPDNKGLDWKEEFMKRFVDSEESDSGSGTIYYMQEFADPFEIRKFISSLISSAVQEKVDRMQRFDVASWLRNKYGLEDETILTAGEVQELAEMLLHDASLTPAPDDNLKE